ncbi:XdhC family protein [Nocardia xishanensis]|uniref:XdhC family protein n=1 Tax=Nocardia xishanensis TaxID=238964 RepID=A0ABW7X781_9NOCA
MREVLPQLREWFDAEEPFVIATVVASKGSAPREPGAVMAVATVVSSPALLGAQLYVWPDRVEQMLGGASGLDAAVAEDTRGMLAQGATGIRHYGPNGERRLDDVVVFVQAYAPPPRMLVFGAIDFTSAVARIGNSWAIT